MSNFVLCTYCTFQTKRRIEALELNSRSYEDDATNSMLANESISEIKGF